jgi:transposase
MSQPYANTARVRLPVRNQMKLDERSLDQLLPPDHVARIVWDFVVRLDLTPFLARIKAVAGHPGQPTIDPRILLSLWLLATLDGVGSARELDRLTTQHIAYQWLCGDVSVNYHTLADFRTSNLELLDDLLTQSVATLRHEGLVELKEVAQDGLRVRASAGSRSFRRRITLEQQLAEARQQVEALRAGVDEDDGAVSRRQQAARERAACERHERLERALQEQTRLAERQAQVEQDKGTPRREPRVSTTDPQARVMKMADGGFRPAFNVELATDTASGLIVGLDVINIGSDSGQLRPMVQQIAERFGTTPQRALADGDFAHLDDIQTLAADHQVEVYAPIRNAAALQAKGINPYEAKAKDPPAVAAWRERMGTAEAKTVYQKRSQTAEWVNARVRNWGLRQFQVRGLEKVRAEATLYALAHNLMQTRRLRAGPPEGDPRP